MGFPSSVAPHSLSSDANARTRAAPWPLAAVALTASSNSPSGALRS